VRDPFDREGWIFDLKWDGFSGNAETDAVSTVVEPRRGLDLCSNDHHSFFFADPLS